MKHEENSFSLLKKHTIRMESSIHGKMMGVYQLCQDNSTKEHYYTYEVVGDEGDIIGGRLIYQLKDPSKALAEWDNYINGDLNNNDVIVSKQELFHIRKPKF